MHTGPVGSIFAGRKSQGPASHQTIHDHLTKDCTDTRHAALMLLCKRIDANIPNVTITSISRLNQAAAGNCPGSDTNRHLASISYVQSVTDRA